MQDETYLIQTSKKYTYKFKYLNTAKIKMENTAIDCLENAFKTPSSPLRYIYVKEQRISHTNDKKNS
jgi:hypothetical protein